MQQSTHSGFVGKTNDPETKNEQAGLSPSILESVSLSQQNETLRTFNPQTAALNHLEKIDERERDILTRRYGLLDGTPQTLENIGKHLNLTRERVRQIEKEALAKMKRMPFSQILEKDVDLIENIIESKGEIVSEKTLLETLLSQQILSARQSVLFILHIGKRFNFLKETAKNHDAWYLDGFEPELAAGVSAAAQEVLDREKKPQNLKSLIKKIHELGEPDPYSSLSPETIESIFEISKKIDRNPFGQWGKANWPEINPKDVGDKAYLVLVHNKQPAHFEEITGLINKQKFDPRTAHKETVHNELIKDKRFVLIGRGIYALREWGYERGTVAEIMASILRGAGRPLAKKEIVEEVLKQRVVKKNTIIIGLSNKDKFQKTADNKYILKSN